MGTAQSQAEEFLQHIGLADEGVVIGDKIVGGESAGGLAWRRMTDGAPATIDINPENAGVQAFGDDLVVIAHRIIAVGPVQETIDGMEEHATTMMPDGLVGEVDEDLCGSGHGQSGIVQRVALEAVVVGVRQIGHGPRGGRAGDGAGFDPGVINEQEMIGGKAGRKRDPEQAGIIPTLALVSEVEHEFFFGRARGVLKRPDAALALPHA